MSANIICYNFASTGGPLNKEVSLVFSYPSETSWTALLEQFICFLEANGYVFSPTHPLKELANAA